MAPKDSSILSSLYLYKKAPAGWQTLPRDELDEPMLSTMKRPAMLEQAEQMTLEDDMEGLK